MADEARSRLGRGLASLIGDVGVEAKAERSRSQRRVPIEFIRPNPRNPRRQFDDSELDELAASIREHGVIQPIVVRSLRGAGEAYEIIAGERRWRASQRAGLHEVPIVPIDVSDAVALQLMIIENIQREDLNAMEEARGYQTLAQEFKLSADDIAKDVGKSRSHVANMMRLTKLPEPVQQLILSGELSAGHARALINVPDPLSAARRIIAEGLSVREAEALAHDAGVPVKPQGKPRASKTHKDADTRNLEQRVSDVLGLSVSVDHRNPGGVLHIRYGDLDQLDEVLRRLGAGR